jgi:hypothetical protein
MDAKLICQTVGVALMNTEENEHKFASSQFRDLLRNTS